MITDTFSTRLLGTINATVPADLFDDDLVSCAGNSLKI
jgi:hypothetical protein